MAFENLFIRSEKSIAGIRLDAVIQESHESEIRTTSNPVELGADINDHSVILPKRLRIVAQVSDTPLGSAAISEIVDSVTDLFGSSTQSNVTRSTNAYRNLVAIQEARDAVEVQTNLKLYQNMLISRISVTQDKDSSRVVLLNIDLNEIRVTESINVTLNPSQIEAGRVREQASPTQTKGRVSPVNPSESVRKSGLKTILDFAGL